MEKALEYLLTLIGEQLNVSTSGKSVLLLDLKSYLPELDTYSRLIMDTAVKPVAYSILGFLLLLELQQLAQRFQSSNAQTYGMELFFKLFLKVGICSLIMRNLSTFLNAILGMGTKVTRNIADLQMGLGSKGNLNVEQAMETVEKLKFFPQLFLGLILFVVLLVTLAASVIVKVIIFMRFLELYILMCVSPLPICTLPNAELSTIGKNFFKIFVAAALQGVLLFIVLSFFPIVINSAFSLSDETSMMGIAIALLCNSGALCMSLLSTNKWSKSIATAA